MHLTFRGVNDAFRGIVKGIQASTIPTIAMPSRYGDVLRIPEPLTITYTNPKERVLFNIGRDANCFFHLVEVCWLLAGRNDVAPLAYYNPKMAEFSDDGLTYNAPYGYRWRNADAIDRANQHQNVDQLDFIVKELKQNPTSRRCVLSIWDIGRDLLNPTSKDLACNISAVFQILDDRLDLTVYNRSNDLVWGTLGANVVQFSYLLEYMANRIAVPMGYYHQVSCNSHVYVATFKPEVWFPDEYQVWMEYATNVEDQTVNGGVLPSAQPMVSNWKQDAAGFDAECRRFVDDPFQQWQEPWLEHVVKPMCLAFKHHKAREYYQADQALRMVCAEDWQVAGRQWIAKRRRNWELKQEKQDAALS